MQNNHELTIEKNKRLENKIYRELGDTITNALNNPNVVEVMLNPDGSVWIEELAKGIYKTNETMSPTQAHSLIHVIANLLDQPVSIERPVIEGILPFNGSRFEGLLPPIVENPTYTIRKKAERIFTLDDYLNQGSITQDDKYRLEQEVLKRSNILVTGGTGSGKTTFANALIHSISVLTPEHRIITLEDTPELSVASKNVVNLYTSDFISMRSLLKITMRMRPDRIIPGEVRDGAALDMLKSWNTGHPGGISTLHANSVEDSLIRLEQLIAEVISIPMTEIIRQTIDTIIFIKRNHNKREIIITNVR